MENIDKLLKDKLESYRPDFDDAAWGAFSSRLEKAQLPFYKKWFGPYLLNGVVWLATVAFLFYFWPTNKETASSNSGQLVQRLVLTDTVFVRDTVYLENTSTERKEKEVIAAFQAPASSNVIIPPSVDPPVTSSIPDPAASQNSIAQAAENHEPEPENKKGSARKVISQKYSDNTLHWQDTISEREMMRYLFGSQDSTASSTREAHPFEETGNSFKAKKTTHFDIKAGPLLRLMYPVDGFVDEEDGYLRPGFQLSLVWNRQFSLNMGIQAGNTKVEVADWDELPIEKLNQLPAWEQFPFELDNIRINTEQFYFPVDVSYHTPVYKGIGVFIKAGVVPHYIRKQEFYYDPIINASQLGTWTQLEPKTWQISYLQTGLGINYQISPRLSTYLDGEYWHGIRPIGGERNRYRWMGLSLGLNFHLLPNKP